MATDRQKSDRLFEVLAIAFAVVAAFYVCNGLARLVFDVPGSVPIDLRLRWVEGHLFVDGVNPQLAGHPDPLLPDSHRSMRETGGSYPPWAYTLGLFFTPPIAWSWARWYAGVVSCLALCALGAFAAWSTAGLGWIRSSFVISTLLSNFSIAICVSYGQYAVPILGLFALSVWLVSLGRDIAAGLLLGIAMVKPQLVALFLLGLLLTGHVRLILAAAMVVIVSTITTMAVLHSPIGPLLANAGNEAELYYHLSHNPLLPWLADEAGFRSAVSVLGILGIAGVVLGWWRLGRSATPLRLASLSCIATMCWTYRKHYDVALMAIPMLELWCLTLTVPRSAWRWTITLLVGLTIWLPLRDQQWSIPVVAWGQLAAWMAAGIWLAVAPPTTLSAETRAARPAAA